MIRINRVLLTVSLFIAFACRTSFACIWNSDTLRSEAEHQATAIAAITGRFDRFPNEYFEVRLARATADIEKNPSDFDAYDDAATASDRLGDDDSAIALMTRKKAALDKAGDGGTGTGDRDQVYRYLANLGTFHAHRWIRAGANRSNLDDLNQAQSLLSEAIKHNPNAHFGRERYQLLAVQWLMSPPPCGGEAMKATILNADPRIGELRLGPIPGHRLAQFADLSDASDGFAGLVVLGSAWESVDVFLALGAVLDDRGETAMASACQLRIDELLASGKKSLHPELSSRGTELTSYGTTSVQRKLGDVKEWYIAARQEADRWREARNKYVLARLAKGDHPDSNSHFWDEWKEPSSPPTPPGASLGLLLFNRGGEATLIALGAVAAISLIAAVVLALCRKAAVK